MVRAGNRAQKALAGSDEARFTFPQVGEVSIGTCLSLS